jgi:hypothetical protein
MSGPLDHKLILRFPPVSGKPEAGVAGRIPGVLNFSAKPDNILDLPQPFFYARIAPV